MLKNACYLLCRLINLNTCQRNFYACVFNDDKNKTNNKNKNNSKQKDKNA